MCYCDETNKINTILSKPEIVLASSQEELRFQSMKEIACKTKYHNEIALTSEMFNIMKQIDENNHEIKIDVKIVD